MSEASCPVCQVKLVPLLDELICVQCGLRSEQWTCKACGKKNWVPINRRLSSWDEHDFPGYERFHLCPDCGCHSCSYLEGEEECNEDGSRYTSTHCIYPEKEDTEIPCKWLEPKQGGKCTEIPPPSSTANRFLKNDSPSRGFSGQSRPAGSKPPYSVAPDPNDAESADLIDDGVTGNLEVVRFSLPDFPVPLRLMYLEELRRLMMGDCSGEESAPLEQRLSGAGEAPEIPGSGCGSRPLRAVRYCHFSESVRCLPEAKQQREEEAGA